MRPTKEQRLKAIHQDALTEFDNAMSAQGDERQQCLEDRRFYSIAGAQWEGSLLQQFENKPRLEVNKIHLSVIRIINEYRNNRITVDFIPKDGSENTQIADACDGLFRADEENSCAEEAYDNAFEEAVGGGFGAFRLRADYEDEEDDENDHQRVYIEPIYDADACVFFDSSAKRQDKSDARRCWVLTSMSKSQYVEEYDDDPESWTPEVTLSEFDWSTDDSVYVAEYYRREQKRESVFVYETLDGEEERYTSKQLEADPELQKKLEATGAKLISEKRVKRQRIHKYIMSGGGVLEDCGVIAGKHIPIIPVYGKRWFVDNIERCMGHVRLSKDTQRVKNMQISKLAEISALSSVEKPIFDPEQMAGHSTMWSKDNIENYPYLLANNIKDANGNIVAGPAPQAYTKSPEIPPAMAALLQLTEQDMKDLLGNQQAGEEIISNISGKAVELIQNKLDMQTYIYMSNFAKAIKRAGEVWLSIVKDILVEPGRKMRTVGKQYDVGQVELMQPVQGEEGELTYRNNLADADLDVWVTVGPSSSSKRASTVRALTGMMTLSTDAETQQVLSAMAMMNMEGEGIEDVRDYFRKKLLRMGVVKPSEQEAKELQAEAQNQQPDPNAEYLKAAAENEKAKAIQTQTDAAYNVARTEKTKADTMETLNDIQQSKQQHLVDLAKELGDAGQPND